jgi:hypothetical protein
VASFSSPVSVCRSTEKSDVGTYLLIFKRLDCPNVIPDILSDRFLVELECSSRLGFGSVGFQPIKRHEEVENVRLGYPSRGILRRLQIDKNCRARLRTGSKVSHKAFHVRLMATNHTNSHYLKAKLKNLGGSSDDNNHGEVFDCCLLQGACAVVQQPIRNCKTEQQQKANR